MAELVVKNGDHIVIDENNWPDLITKLSVEDGVLTVQNNSDEIKLLNFDTSVYMKVNPKGVFNIIGKPVQIGTGTGELGQELSLPINGHSIGGLWIETGEGTGVFEKWLLINGGSVDGDFNNVGDDNLTGNFYKIEDGVIKFATEEGRGNIPANGAKIMCPNIIVSSGDGDSESSSARFEKNLYGNLFINNVAFSNIYKSIFNFSSLIIKNSSFKKGVDIEYSSNVSLDNLAVSVDSKYSSGVTVYYSSSVKLNDVHAVTLKYSGLGLYYLTDVKVDSVRGYVLNRESNQTNAVNLRTLTRFDAKNIESFGANTHIYNVTDANIDKISAINYLNRKLTSLYSQGNVLIEQSTNVIIKEINIPENGISSIAPLSIRESSKVYVLKLKGVDTYASYALNAAVVFDSKFANFDLPDVQDTPVNMNNKNDGIELINFSMNKNKALEIGSLHTVIKGAYVKDVVLENSGAIGTNIAQLYDDDGRGKLKILFSKNPDIITVIKGSPIFNPNGSVTLSKGCIFEIKTPFAIRGVSFTGEEPTIEGSIGNASIYFQTSNYKHKSDMLSLTGDNLNSVNSLLDNSFILTLRIDGSNMDEGETATLTSITIPTYDERASYPVFYKPVRIVFDTLISSDETAVFALMYADSYKNGKGVFLTDKDGNPIAGYVNGASEILRYYDFETNDEYRAPGQDFNAILVVTSAKYVEPLEIPVSFTSDFDVSVNVKSKTDNVIMLLEDTDDSE